MSDREPRSGQYFADFSRSKFIIVSCLLPVLALGLACPPSMAQQVITPGDDRSSLEWLDFKQARYIGKPILVHLRSGYERAVIFPEPIQLSDPLQSLPGCAVAIENEVVGFFPTHTFRRTSIKFSGLNTGIVYELRVRASHQGIEQVLQISR